MVTHATVKAAHTAALAGIKACIKNQSAVVGATLANWTNTEWSKSTLVSNFAANNALAKLPHVEVVGNFTHSKPAKTSKILVMLDADIPPKTGGAPGAPKEPHIGWEVEVNGKRAGNGHELIKEGVLKNGRRKSSDPSGTGWENIVMENIEKVPGKNEKLVFEQHYWRLL